MRYIVGQYRFPYAFQAMKSLSSPTGYSSPCSRTARSTFSTDRSNANSGEWTPTTVKSGWYRQYIRRRNGRVCWQFTHAKVQNSSSTSRSRRFASSSGAPSGVLSHGSTPMSSGPRPSTDKLAAASSPIGVLPVSRRRKFTLRYGDAASRSWQSHRLIADQTHRLASPWVFLGSVLRMAGGCHPVPEG